VGRVAGIREVVMLCRRGISGGRRTEAGNLVQEKTLLVTLSSLLESMAGLWVGKTAFTMRTSFTQEQ